MNNTCNNNKTLLKLYVYTSNFPFFVSCVLIEVNEWESLDDKCKSVHAKCQITKYHRLGFNVLRIRFNG